MTEDFEKYQRGDIMKRLGLIMSISVLFTLFCLLPFTACAYEETPVVGGGAIKGKVIYNGAVPMRKVIPTKDQEVCGGIREDPQVLIGPNNGVLDAIVYLKDVPKGRKWDKSKAELANHQCQFNPHVQVIPVGKDVTIVNSDPVLHNTHGFLIRTTVFNVAMPKQGMRVARPLRKPGIIRVECDAHGWMLAWIYVADNPYYVMTGKDGTFTIPDVLPGNYTLVVWQEYAGSKEIPVTVKARETVALHTIELKK